MGKGKPRSGPKEGAIVTVQKTVYLCGQDRDEGACVQPNSNILDHVHNELMSDVKLNRFYNFNLQPWEFFPEYKTPENAPDAKIDYYDHCGWNGLRKLFPFIDRDENIECLVTLVFERKDTWCGWNEDREIEEYDRSDELFKLYNFHCEADIWAVTTANGDIMLSKKEKNLNWEIDDGYLKWDCYERGEGGMIYTDSCLYDLFPDSQENNGVGVPLKIHVIVDAVV